MAIHTVFGTATPPGTHSWNTDGTPAIEVAQEFYLTTPSGTKVDLANGNVVGGRTYIPASATNLPAQVTFRAYLNPDYTTVVATKTVSVPGAGQWVEALFDTPIPTPAVGEQVAISVQFAGSTAADECYIFANGARGTSAPLPSPTADMAWTEFDTALDFYSGWYRISPATTRSPIQQGTQSYLIDILVDDGEGEPAPVPPVANAGVDQNVETGTQVTLDGSASAGGDGTITSYAWSQTSGPTVTLAGSGAVRTFTPTEAGTYVFQLTVTNSLSEVDDDSVQVTVTTEPPPPDPEFDFGATIAEENEFTGSAKQNWFDGVETEQMPAFGRSTYYLPGDEAEFSIDYNLPFKFNIFRLGDYQGNGARLIQSGIVGTPTDQPAPAVIPNSNGAVTSAAWSVNATWSIPENAQPGWYYALLLGDNGTDFGQVLFLVSDKLAKKPTVIVTGDATWHAAYNGFGGNNVYGAAKGLGDINQRALCSSYDNPVLTRDYVPQTHFFNNSYPYIKWSERMGYEAGVTTIEQIKDDPSILDGRDLIVWVGHNEYIPDIVMNKTKSLIAAGQNMLNVAGNDFFWRVRFTDGAFNSSNDGRVMWCKKDTISGPSAIRTGGAGTPFTNEADWTGTWQDTRWSLRQPSEDFFGDRFIANGIRADQVKVPASMKSLPPWRDCAGVQALTTGQEYSFTAGSLGMEWDMPVLANTNVEQVPFSSSEVDLINNASDINGEDYGTTLENVIHSFCMVRNGISYIANFNSDQWAWALDSLHLRGTAAADANAMQMMLNVISDLGVQPDITSVQTASLTVPTPVALTEYGFNEDPPPPTFSDYGYYYSDGVQWHKLV